MLVLELPRSSYRIYKLAGRRQKSSFCFFHNEIIESTTKQLDRCALGLKLMESGWWNERDGEGDGERVME